MSMLDPLTCGFGRAAIYQILSDKSIKRLQNENLKVYTSRVYKDQYAQYLQYFNNEKENFHVEYEHFKLKFPKITKYLDDISKRKPQLKKQILEHFSEQTWKELGEQRQRHCLNDCKGCLKDKKSRNFLSQLPVKNRHWKNKADQAGLYKKKALEDLTNTIITDLNSEYQTKYRTSFITQAKKHIPEFADTKAKDLKAVAKAVVEDCEMQFEETSVTRAFGVPISLRNRAEHRLIQGFEPREAAIIRTEKTNEDIRQGIKRHHSHIGNKENFTFTIAKCIEEVESYSCDHKINYSDLSRRHQLLNKKGIIPANGGQIIKELLLDLGVDLSKFHHKEENNDLEKFRIRRKKRRLNIPNMRDITLPIDESNEEVKKKLKQDIIDGKINIGELIVPQSYTKVTMVDGEIKTEEISIEGRKIPLNDIRRSTLLDHKKFMRLRSDIDYAKMSREEIKSALTSIGEYFDDDINNNSDILLERLKCFERTRNLMIWHDCSTISSHSHFLITVSSIYDPAVYYTTKEYFEKFKKSVDIQATIEKPTVYILARCPSNDRQLLYSEERINDICQTKENIIIDNIPIKDVTRIFKGDKPAAQLEAGQQKGGNYYCFLCSLHADCSKSMIHCANLESFSLQYRLNKLQESFETINKIKNMSTNYFSKLKKHEIINELHQRGVKFISGSNVEILRVKLEEEMHGIHRTPALLFSRPETTIADSCLGNYEILFTEPLHDVSNHIKNLYEEIPHHFKKEKNLIEQTISISFNNKQAKNSADHRKSLLIVCKWFMDNYPQHYVTQILKTLAEMQEILYLSEDNRTIQKVLRLGTVVLTHAILLNKNFLPLKSKLTERKFYGSYYHSLIHHSTYQYRIISGRAANTEKEEATFNTLKTVTNLRSNHHAEHVLTNALIHLETRKQWKKDDGIKSVQSKINALYKPIKFAQSDTLIPFSWIREKSSQYQSFLQCYADFLLEEKIWWVEENDGVRFQDMSKTETKLQKHHFRSSNIQREQQHVQECWQKCLLQKNKLIPAFKLKVNVDGSTTNVYYLKTLMHFQQDLKQLDTNEIYDDSTLITEHVSTSTEEYTSTVTEENTSTIDFINVTPMQPLSFSSCPVESTASLTTPLTSLKTISTPLTTLNTISTPSTSIQIISTPSASLKTTSTPSTSIKSIPALPTTSTPVSKHPPYLTSTPIQPEKRNKKKEAEILSLKLKAPNVRAQEGLSHTATMLKRILGDDELVQKYDKCHKRLKAYNNTTSKNAYKDILAQLEIKLNIRHDQLREKLKSLEISKLTETEEHNDEKRDEEYSSIIDELKILKFLRKQWNL